MGRFREYVMVGVAIAVCGGVLLPEAWAQSAPEVSVIPAAVNVTEQQSFAVTVEVAKVMGAPAPTGTVVLSAGNFRASAALQAGGVAALTVPGGVLATGTDVLTASYSPDVASAVYYGGSSGQGKVVVYPDPAYFSIAAPGLTIARGDTSGNTVSVKVEPYRGFAGLVSLTAAITGSPKQVYDLPTLSFGSTNPVSLTGGTAGTALLTVTTTGKSSVAGGAAEEIPMGPAGGITLAGLALLSWPLRKRKWMQHRTMRALHVMGVLLLSLGLMGCGVQGAAVVGQGTTPGNYIVTVTGVATGASATGQFVVTVR